MNSCQKYFSRSLLATAALLAGASPAWAQVSLGAASNFAALGGAGVTCTTPLPPLPAFSVTGDVGSLLTAPTSVTGFPGFTPGANPCSLSGDIHLGAVQAYNDIFVGVGSAYEKLKAMTCDPANHLSGQLGGLTLPPGVYCFDTTALLTAGTLTLDGGGDNNAVWVFQIGTAITTGTASVLMTDSGQACNVFWELGTAATIGTGTAFIGNILAGSAVSFTGMNSSLVGRVFAKTAVTMTGTNINNDCASQPGPGPEPKPGKCSDRVTGGGYITVNGKKANFGVTGGIRKGKFRGHLTYIDHGIGLTVKGTGVTNYVVSGDKTRRIEGTAKINGVAGTYTVVVSDNGEPGKNKDSFAITLSTGYSASGTLAGGNIQIHKRHCGKKDSVGNDNDDDDDGDDEGDD